MVISPARRKLVLGMFLAVYCGIYCAHAAAAGLEAQWVLYNGKILTADTEDPEQFSIAQAVAIYDGKFVVVGNNQAALATAGPSTRKIDLQGKTVIPGMIETHLHVNTMAISHHLKKTPSATDMPLQGRRDEVLQQLRGLAHSRKPGEWIVLNSVRILKAGERPAAGGGGNAFGVESEPPLTLAELDSAAPDNPVLIGGGYFPSQVNSKALDLLEAKYPGIPGVLKGKDGKPTGTIEITAAFTIQELTPTPLPRDLEASRDGFRQELVEAAARGLTAVATRVDWDALRAYMLLDEKGEMPIRLSFATEMAAYSPMSDVLFRRINLTPGYGSPMLWTSGATTGTVEYGNGPANGDACIHGTYPKDSKNFPNWHDETWGPSGDCRLTAGPNAQVLRNFFFNAIRSGWNITNIHINGDKGLDDYMDMLDEIHDKYGVDVASLRFSSDHCGYISEKQAERAKRLGITFSCTPNAIMNGERGTVGAYSQIYDRERAADAYSPFRRLARTGMKPSAHCEGHQDWDFNCMQLMVTRKDETTGAMWGPQQTIDRREALYTFTRWASWHVWKEDKIGSIEPGKWADLVILDKDFMNIPADQLNEINPLLTVVGGNVAYSEPKFAASVGLPTVGFQAPEGWWMRKPRAGGDGM
jgi:predicted amidohydrolase YtcJ